MKSFTGGRASETTTQFFGRSRFVPFYPKQPMQPDMQANYGMQQPYGGQPMPMPKPYGQPGPQLDQYGKPVPVDQINPGRNPNLWGGG